MRLLARCHNGHGSPAGDNRATKLTWLRPACSRGDDAVPVAGHKLASENVCTEADAVVPRVCKGLLGTHHLRFLESEGDGKRRDRCRGCLDCCCLRCLSQASDSSARRFAAYRSMPPSVGRFGVTQ